MKGIPLVGELIQYSYLHIGLVTFAPPTIGPLFPVPWLGEQNEIVVQCCQTCEIIARQVNP